MARKVTAGNILRRGTDGLTPAQLKELLDNVVKGSIERHGEGVVTFVIDYEGETLPVKYVGRGPLPDTLVDRAQAVAEGMMTPAGTFEATLVQAKCASKYEVAFEEGSTVAE